MYVAMLMLHYFPCKVRRVPRPRDILGGGGGLEERPVQDDDLNRA